MLTKVFNPGKYIDCDSTFYHSEHDYDFIVHCFFENGVFEKITRSGNTILRTFKVYSTGAKYNVVEIKDGKMVVEF